jgi:hypothetical protein
LASIGVKLSSIILKVNYCIVKFQTQMRRMQTLKARIFDHNFGPPTNNCIIKRTETSIGGSMLHEMHGRRDGSFGGKFVLVLASCNDT